MVSPQDIKNAVGGKRCTFYGNKDGIAFKKECAKAAGFTHCHGDGLTKNNGVLIGKGPHKQTSDFAAVYFVTGGKSQYCGTMTHEGLAENKFKACNE